MATVFLVIGVSACTHSESSSEHAIEVEIGVEASVCRLDGQLPAGRDGSECLQLGLPGAEVEIMSVGEPIWADETNEAGEVLAEFTPPGEWFVAVSSPWITEDITSRTFERDATITGFDLSTRDFDLVPMPTAHE